MICWLPLWMLSAGTWSDAGMTRHLVFGGSSVTISIHTKLCPFNETYFMPDETTDIWHLSHTILTFSAYTSWSCLHYRQGLWMSAILVWRTMCHVYPYTWNYVLLTKHISCPKKLRITDTHFTSLSLDRHMDKHFTCITLRAAGSHYAGDAAHNFEVPGLLLAGFS